MGAGKGENQISAPWISKIQLYIEGSVTKINAEH
jgi:hypothetical protein